MCTLFLIVSFFLSFYNLHSEPIYAEIATNEDGEVLYAYQENAIVHPASLTKKMTLYLIFEDLKNRKITPRTRIFFSKKSTKQMPCKLNMRVGDSLSIEEAIKALVTKSANDVAYAVAENLSQSYEHFIYRMNCKARTLGMRNTFFRNSSGVPNKQQVTTAYDMAILGRALYKNFPEKKHYFSNRDFIYRGIVHRNHNRMLSNCIDGIKTGYICDSGFNISTTARKIDKTGREIRVFAVVMGGKTARSRDVCAMKVLNIAFSKLGVPAIQEIKYNQNIKRKRGVLTKKPRLVMTKFQLKKKKQSINDLK